MPKVSLESVTVEDEPQQQLEGRKLSPDFDDRVVATFEHLDWDKNDDLMRKVVLRWHVDLYLAGRIDRDAYRALKSVKHGDWDWDKLADSFKYAMIYETQGWLRGNFGGQLNRIPSPALTAKHLVHGRLDGQSNLAMCGREFKEAVSLSPNGTFIFVDAIKCKQCRKMAEQHNAKVHSQADAAKKPMSDDAWRIAMVEAGRRNPKPIKIDPEIWEGDLYDTRTKEEQRERSLEKVRRVRQQIKYEELEKELSDSLYGSKAREFAVD